MSECLFMTAELIIQTCFLSHKSAGHGERENKNSVSTDWNTRVLWVKSFLKWGKTKTLNERLLQTANVKLNDIFWRARLIVHLKHAFYWLLNKQAHQYLGKKVFIKGKNVYLPISLSLSILSYIYICTILYIQNHI